MAPTSSSLSASSKLRTLALFYRHRICSTNAIANPLSTHQQLRFINNFAVTTRFYREPDMLRHEMDKIQPAPAPPRPSFPVWLTWVLGSLLSFFLPSWKQKLDNLLLLEGKVEKIVEEVETVAEEVEKVATISEKVSADVADKLSNNTRLKEAALTIEHLSNVTAKDAQLTNDFLHKVGDLEEDLKELKTIVEPVFDRNRITRVEHVRK
ncbi:hypothetical protein LguiA_027219 [Lonicera macranthoides]